jgi:hypothetical protein
VVARAAVAAAALPGCPLEAFVAGWLLGAAGAVATGAGAAAATVGRTGALDARGAPFVCGAVGPAFVALA